MASPSSFAGGLYAVLGATGATGSSICKRIAAQGGRVFMVGRDEAALKSLQGTLATLSPDTGVQHLFSVCSDAKDTKHIEEAFKTMPKNHGLNGLVYAAGSITLKPLKRCTTEDFVESFLLNAVGAAHAVRTCHDDLIKGQGSVVLFSTVASQRGFSNHAVVAAAKGAVQGLTLALAAEFAPKNVRVNAIAPSLTVSKMSAKMTEGKMGDAISKAHPIARLGSGDDMASMACFLLDPANSWVTGQIIGVDGGRSSIA